MDGALRLALLSQDRRPGGPPDLRPGRGHLERSPAVAHRGRGQPGPLPRATRLGGARPGRQLLVVGGNRERLGRSPAGRHPAELPGRPPPAAGPLGPGLDSDVLDVEV
ncbi:MAG: hypothetical protein QOH50_5402, partial [Kribbellaceae bacterium]|nr:hypothetical protein [Kribbellaceae bacterium]